MPPKQKSQLYVLFPKTERKLSLEQTFHYDTHTHKLQYLEKLNREQHRVEIRKKKHWIGNFLLCWPLFCSLRNIDQMTFLFTSQFYFCNKQKLLQTSITGSKLIKMKHQTKIRNVILSFPHRFHSVKRNLSFSLNRQMP